MGSDLPEPHPDPGNGFGDTPPLSEAGPTAGDLSAREAVRRTLIDLGPDADLDAVLAHLQTKFGLTPPRGTVQTYLSLAKKDLRDGVPSEPRRRGRPRKATSNGHPSAPSAPAVEEVIEAVEVLRDLCDRFGDDNVRRLLDAL